MNPLVSLVVPTKNRYPYLEKLVDLVIDFNFGDEFELVIQDNNEDNSNFIKFLETRNYKNIKYFHYPSQMPIGENCDKAIRHSTGDYVCFIGDDDFVTKNFIPCVEWMRDNKVECVFPKRIKYFWPDYCDKGEERAAIHHDQFTKNITYIGAKDALKDVMNIGCIWPGNMPMIYHGIVKRTVLEKIWKQCGTLFPGASPDIASGVSLCMVIDKYVSFKFPIIIAGNSRTGGGSQKVIKHHAVTDFKKLPFLPQDIENRWDKRIPKIWSNSTIWSESAVEALKAWNRNDLVNNVNYEALYENFVINYFYYRKMAFSLTNNKCKLFFKSIIGVTQLILKQLAKLYILTLRCFPLIKQLNFLYICMVKYIFGICLDL